MYCCCDNAVTTSYHLCAIKGVTQPCILVFIGPKPETISDFWQMVVDHKPSVVVMLTKVNESGKVRCKVSEGTVPTTIVYASNYAGFIFCDFHSHRCCIFKFAGHGTVDTH